MSAPRCTHGQCQGGLWFDADRGFYCCYCGREYGVVEPSMITKLLSNTTPEAAQSSGIRVSPDTAAIVARVRAEMARNGPPKRGRPPRPLRDSCDMGHFDWQVYRGGGRYCRPCKNAADRARTRSATGWR